MLKDTPAVSFDNLYRQLNASDTKPGVTQIDILAFPPPLATVFHIISRKHTITAAEFATEFELTEAQAEQLVAMLVDKGYLVASKTDNTETAYKINYTRNNARNNPRKETTDIWNTLDL